MKYVLSQAIHTCNAEQLGRSSSVWKNYITTVLGSSSNNRSAMRTILQPIDMWKILYISISSKSPRFSEVSNWQAEQVNCQIEFKYSPQSWSREQSWRWSLAASMQIRFMRSCERFFTDSWLSLGWPFPFPNGVKCGLRGYSRKCEDAASFRSCLD